MFSKILIANRGEIAVRIIRACKEMGIATVAVYSQADADALHVALADESVCIGPPAAGESYLNMHRVDSAALVTGAQAIHPGYGFLSENAAFARLCQDNNLTFIGPTPEIMELLSDKQQAKAAMERAGVPVIPGTRIVPDVPAALQAAEEVGYPIMLKARAGGGGRGIRMVQKPEDMESAFQVAAQESQSAFGDNTLYLEKCIYPARHIEVQVLADEAHHCVCLGERDCSIQQHNQKLIEETPSPAISPAQRSALIERVTRAVSRVGYVNAGTLEFLLDGHGNYYFMEMNVRLQVEHAVTEMLTGVDIVKWQIRLAAGVLLNFTQQDVSFSGTALECRINAAAPGTVGMLHVPGGPSVRFDTFLWSGLTVSPYYDALLGKLIVHAGTREETIRKMDAALCELVIEGVPNNIENQIHIIQSEGFRSGHYHLDSLKKDGE